MKINYLIAASAHRVKLNAGYGIESKKILNMHLDQLVKRDASSLAQVTILRALPLIRYDNKIRESKEYWDIKRNSNRVQCPVKKLDFPDAHFSYGMWIRAMQRYVNEFDYYILIEDDYYPAIDNFAEILVDLHQRKLPSGGYLNSFTAGDCAAVSNGICDSASVIKGLKALDDPLDAISAGAQSLFGPTLFGENMTDYTDEYRTLFNNRTIVEETHDENLNLKTDIFNPIQYLGTGEQDFPKSVWHQS